MRKLGFSLLFFLVLLSSYIIWSYFANPVSDTVVTQTSQKEPYGHQLSPSNTTDQNFQEELFDSGKKKIDSAKSFAEQIPGAAHRTFNDLLVRAKNITREKIDAILETPTLREAGPASSPAFSATPGNTAGNSTPSQNSSTELQVCFIVQKGTLVDYSIDQPFPGVQEALYTVAWGDGETIHGLFHSGDQHIVVSHTYAQQGTYAIIFQLKNSSTTLTISRSVCVKG